MLSFSNHQQQRHQGPGISRGISFSNSALDIKGLPGSVLSRPVGKSHARNPTHGQNPILGGGGEFF